MLLCLLASLLAWPAAALASTAAPSTVADGWTRQKQGVHGRCMPCRATLRLNPAAASSNTVGGSQVPPYVIEEQPTDSWQGPKDYPSDYLLSVTVWDTYEKEGWDKLQISVNARVPIPEVIKAHAAGYAEAYFTAHSIWDYWNNYKANEWAASGGVPSPGLVNFIEKQATFIRRNVAERGAHNKYWQLMGLLMSQFDGLVEGYIHTMPSPSNNLSWQELYMLQSVGDLYELNVLYPPVPPKQEGQAVQAVQRQYTPGHGIVGPEGYGELLECSALIKVDLASYARRRQVLQSHGSSLRGQLHAQPEQKLQSSVTWGNQLAQWLQQALAWVMPAPRTAIHTPPSSRPLLDRISQNSETHEDQLKGSQQDVSNCEHEADGDEAASDDADVNFWAGHNTWRPYYAMRRLWKMYTFPWVETGPIAVSSSPGILFSKDDWYTTDRFVVMETTNGIYNKTLYDDIQPECALMWQRVMVANWGATSGREWMQLFAKANSGTYNNQWMVLDVKALHAAWQHDVLWVCEQIPGRIEKADVTQVLLSQGYWASFNVPYYPIIYNLTGYPVDQDMWHTCPRARIFARDAPCVNSISGLKKLLRYNRYQKDELSLGRPNNAIAARYDLLPLPGCDANYTRKAFGAVDAKLVSARTFKDRITHVICGPTADDQVPFKWDGQFQNISHVGTADVFNFTWQQYAMDM